MTIKVDVIEPETCAVCGKGLVPSRNAIVFYFHAKRRAGAWHAKCGPLPSIAGLTARAINVPS